MSKTVYVLMARQQLPTYICIPYPVAVFATRREANAALREKRASRSRLEYYLRPAKMEDPND